MSFVRKCMYQLLILLILSQYVFCELKSVNACKIKGTTKCSECIAILPECGWCTQENFTETASERCDTVVNLIAKGCQRENVTSPNHEETFVKNDDVRNGQDDKPAIHLKPQHIKVKLRRNKPYKFPVTFRVAENFPVDLYFLLDLSVTMQDEKGQLAAMASKIAEKVETITTNYQFGFGSFLDKVILPLTMTTTGMLENPCQNKTLQDTCEPPYGFKHRLRLVKNQKDFVDMVQNAALSNNSVGPEGGLDAIMQAVVCGDIIGWRNNSRKILIYSSDRTFHIAGDGKLAGIVKPNDGKCHMDENNRYAAELDQDYPSVAQLARKVFENSVNIIFAVPQNNTQLYTALSGQIKGSRADTLEEDSSNIVHIIDDFYQSISSSVELRHTGINGVSMEFRSKCTYRRTLTKTYSCTELKIGDSVEFEVELEARECPIDPEDRFQTIEITPVGIQEKIILEVEIVCECPCEETGNKELNSPFCTNGNGTYACGVCACNKYRYGDICQCDGRGDSTEGSDRKCIREKSTSGLPCSGRGECLCGQCICNEERYRGKYCECDHLACEYDEVTGKLCGGPDQGQCICGECQCKEDFQGDDCGCPTSTDSCLFEGQDKVCNGHGKCVCGRCRCDDGYIHPTCNDCLTCRFASCEGQKECALCALSGKKDCGDQCSNVTLVDFLEDLDGENTTSCAFHDDNGCIWFTYHVEDDDVIVQVLDDKGCTAEVDIVPIIIGIVASILIAGIILLVIWKCLISAYDKIEFARFQNEVDNLKWAKEENPLYEGAIQRFDNPICGEDID